MNFSTYLYQVGMSFQKILNIQSPKPYQYNHNYLSPEKEDKLKKKCQKAAQEITYLKSFNHWPLATSKQNLSGTNIHHITEKCRNKYVDNKYTDNKYTDNKYTDNKYVDNKYVDQVIMIKNQHKSMLSLKYFNRSN